MEDQLAEYIRKHTLVITFVVLIGFIALAAGEFYLYRQQMYLNKMISEGFMQLKEQAQNQAVVIEMPDSGSSAAKMKK